MTIFHLLGNNCFSVQDTPEPELWADVLVEAGLTRLEYFADHLEPIFFRPIIKSRGPFLQKTLDVLRDRGIEVIATGTGRISYLLNVLSHPYPDAAEAGVEWCRAYAELAVALGARFVTGHYDYISLHDNENHRNESLVRLEEGLLRFADHAAGLGLDAIFLEQMYTPHLLPYTIAGAKEMLERLNARSALPFYLHIDTGHTIPVPSDDPNHTDADKDIYAWLSTSYPPDSRRIFVHLQQHDGVGSRHWAFTGERNREGRVEAKRVIQAIEESGVEEAWLSFEIQFPRGAALKEIAPELRESRDYFCSAFRELGYVEEGNTFVREGGGVERKT